MKHIYIILLLLFSEASYSQNLVPNGSFEQYTSCPNQASEIDSALYWMNPDALVGGGGTPDYYNLCSSNGFSIPDNDAGYQQPYDGVAYAGIYLWNDDNDREFIEVTLSSTLISGECYHISFHCSLADQVMYSTYNIGAYFSDTIIENVHGHYPLPFTPQIVNTTGDFFDTLNWTLVEGDYMATGGENYLVIGNFNDNANTDTMTINVSAPSQSAYIYIDSVSLVPTTCVTGINEVKKETVKAFPNPVSDNLTIQLSSNEPAEIILYDVTSRKLLEQKVMGSSTINIKDFSKGIYFYEVRNKVGVIGTGKVAKE